MLCLFANMVWFISGVLRWRNVKNTTFMGIANSSYVRESRIPIAQQLVDWQTQGPKQLCIPHGEPVKEKEPRAGVCLFW